MARLGSEKPGHKYIRRVPDGIGGYKYVYTAPSGAERMWRTPGRGDTLRPEHIALARTVKVRKERTYGDSYRTHKLVTDDGEWEISYDFVGLYHGHYGKDKFGKRNDHGYTITNLKDPNIYVGHRASLRTPMHARLWIAMYRLEHPVKEQVSG